jgi:hypothetical protein
MSNDYQIYFRLRGRDCWTPDEKFPAPVVETVEALHWLRRQAGDSYEFRMDPIEKGTPL